MDGIVHDLEMDVKDLEYEEKTAADDYADLMAESQGKLMETKEALSGAAEDVRLSAATITDLHASCDFIMQNYDMRKEARANEVDSLKNAKAVLSGAKM